MKTKKDHRYRYILLLAPVVLLLIWICQGIAFAQPVPLPSIHIGVEGGTKPEKVSVLLEILFLLTVLSLAPSVLIMMTSFTRLVVVFSLLRQAIGTQQMPPGQLLIGLSLFLTFFIMTPVWKDVHKNALSPYLEEEISQKEALDSALKPIREFMFKQTREKDLVLFLDISGMKKPRDPSEVSTSALIPAFVISELRTAFEIGFMLYIPFLIVDMVVASVLLSMGMMMLPPFMISLPFKLMLFVLVDGWYLIVGSIVNSFY
jgi:flagellar biosynthetic protein FliP